MASCQAPRSVQKGKHDSGEGPLCWEDYFDRRQIVTVPEGEFAVYRAGVGGVVLLLLHGGGLASQSWALFAREAASRIPNSSVVAVDFRGHGATSAAPEDDLSKETLCADLLAVTATLQEAEEWKAVHLVGHSMGGAIAVHLAATCKLPRLASLTVVDVVEGSALDAVRHMNDFLKARPVSFPSLDAGIEWVLSTRQLRNRGSARVSVPSQLVETTAESGRKSWRWRVDLAASEPHWAGWFEGLSATFLAQAIPKLLILAGITTLDKDLTIGQMQGKFQLEVLERVGHCVHEDAPAKVVEIIAKFVDRVAGQKKRIPADTRL